MRKKGQSIVEYMIIFAVVIAAVVAMKSIMQGKTQALTEQAGTSITNKAAQIGTMGQ